MPAYPDGWATCGACASGGVAVGAIQVRPGDTLRLDDPMLTLDTGKVSLDIPGPRSDRVLEVHVRPGDPVPAGAPRITLALA